ncbi:MAG: hypothetical protein IKR53_03370 [Clostridia bacterium]|nr:hypothetical protein [Clostridia bacterium]
MELKDYSFDPMTFAFFENEDAELAERVGYALREGAKYFNITFGKNILATVSTWPEDEGATFHFSGGLGYDRQDDEANLEKHPEMREQILEYREKYDPYMRAAHCLFRSKEYIELNEAGALWGGNWGGHSNPDFGRVINLGTEGIREIINKYKKINTEDSDWFYRGCEYAMDALDILGDRFHALALEEAAKCEDPADKKRYEAAARAFEVVPRKPAYDFTSACQVFWMIFTFDGIDSPGRFDQFMKRAYEITEDKEEVADVLARLWEVFHDTRTWNLCLSGSDENWNDDTNGLTYDILKLAAEKKYQTPNITLRVHRNTPEKLWDAIADTLATGIGMPALYNDEVMCPALEKIGIPPCDSHLYCMNGCNQVDIMGKSHMGLEDGEVVFGKCLEFALHNGINAMDGKDIALHTGDPRKFASYEEVERAFMQQMEYATFHSCEAANDAQHVRATFQPNPFRSCLIEGCLERGIDYRNGGPLYGHGQVLAEAIADTGDSLWAIKKLVFIEKRYTMEQLIDALDANFEGYDELWYDFSHCEKFGNDIDEVDEITAKITNRFFKVLKRHHTYRGGVFTGGCSPFSRAAGYGRQIAALPNGKKKGDPLIADSIAAVPGCDMNGPTAHIKSALRYCHEEACSGFIFMNKFDKKIFDTPKGKEAFKALAKTFFAGGGQQYTVTVVNPEDLLDAKVHPERHRDLIVRVGGYSDYFVNLDEGLQDNVIARTFIDMGV